MGEKFDKLKAFCTAPVDPDKSDLLDSAVIRFFLALGALAVIVYFGSLADDASRGLIHRLFVWSFVIFTVGFAEIFVFFLILTIFGRIRLAEAVEDKPVVQKPEHGAPQASPKRSVSLARIQAFFWTLVVLIVYFHEAVTRGPNDPIPTLPAELLMVMGISGAVYLTSKQMAKP